MAKKTRRSKKRTVIAPSKGDDWLLRFLRQHSIGVMLLALLSAGAGWLVWHSRDCMTDQKTQVAATRKAWIKKRVALQKLLDDDDTLLTRVELFERHQGIGVGYEQWDQDRKALIGSLETLSRDCNDIKVADYELEAQEKDLARVFPFYSLTKPIDDPEACVKFLREAEKLRSPEVAEAGNSKTQKSNLPVSISEFRKTIARGRDVDIKAAESFESVFARLENMSFGGHLKQCF